MVDYPRHTLLLTVLCGYLVPHSHTVGLHLRYDVPLLCETVSHTNHFSSVRWAPDRRWFGMSGAVEIDSQCGVE